MDCKECNDKFEEIIKKPIYKKFYQEIGKLASLPKDEKDFNAVVGDLINLVKNHREQIINYFFVTWLASIDDDQLKKQILRSIFMNNVVVIEESFETNGFKMKISFECKQDDTDV